MADRPDRADHAPGNPGPVQEAFQRVLASTRQLPSPPEVCLRVTQLARDLETTLAEMQSLVESDIALAGRLMQVANSAFFGVREQVTSVRRAIILLGFGTVRSLALGFFLNESFSRLRLPGLPYEELPRYAQAASAVAETIARRAEPALADEAACLGLLHESGVIVMNMAFGSQYRLAVAEARPADRPLWLVEAKAFGVDHALAGGMLLQNWKLDPAVVRVVTDHHRRQPPAELPDADARLLWKILRLAGPVALALAGRDRAAAAAQAVPLAESIFGWDAGELEQILRDALEVYRQRLVFTGHGADEVEADGREALEALAPFAEAT